MKVLVIGSGGREHALAWKLQQSEMVDEIFIAPGNGGTRQIGTNVPIAANDLEGLLDFAIQQKIDVTIVGPEEPLVLGIVDLFQQHGLKIFGPNKKSAQLEGSKNFSKKIMVKYSIPTARYQSYTSFKQAQEGLDLFNYPLVIKADGLALGKGVFIVDSKPEALEVLEQIFVQRIFDSQGSRVVIEEFLTGEEASLLVFVSGNRVFPLQSARDYKRIGENDEGPNTGGVGCYSPSELFTSELDEIIDEKILKPIERGLREEGLEYVGILYIGLMLVDNQPYCLEFNVRFGDPETEVIVPRLESDLLWLIQQALNYQLCQEDFKWLPEAAIGVVVTAEGYPGSYQKGHHITGLDSLDSKVMVFHNGTKFDTEYKTNGGRVLTVVTTCSVSACKDSIYQALEKIEFSGMYYRNDIACHLK